MADFLDQEIQYLPGVGPKRAELLFKELKIKTFRDLIYYFPYKYIDRTRFYSVAEIHSQMPYVQLKGTIKSLEIVGTANKKRLSARFFDASGSIELVWFRGIKWQKDNLKLNKTYIVFGKPSEFNGTMNIVHPEMETEEEKQLKPSGLFQGYYVTSENMKNSYVNSKTINKLQLTLSNLAKGKIGETLPPGLVNRLKLMPLENALISIHKPENSIELRNATFRLKFEELFFVQLKILAIKHTREDKFKGFRFEKIGYNFNTFYNDFLPFELTKAQKKVIREIRRNVNRHLQMNRLLQGDVGSGKTLVALMIMLMALDNEFQCALMAPTEILAQQHYQSITNFLKGMHISVGLLTGSTKKSDRLKLHARLESGELQIIIGTHALLEDVVAFKNLGLVVIDEQHRFGVAQRAKLWQKNNLIPPHVLVMTATPIPRTLAMTVYGDLDVSVIDELPPGRRPVETWHFFENQQNHLHKFLRSQLKKGAQIYIVYPLITESEKMDLKDLEAGYRHFSEAFPDVKVGIVHGKMKPALKESAMQAFKKGTTKILVATTVIEVGVDVPQATVMVIESAERFGLSQLHQLRGRVGRGAQQSYCILLSSYKLGVESKKRLETMVNTNDGFEIAEVDMKIRGPGEIDGTQQSGIGFDLKIAKLSTDGKILQMARDMAMDILDDDPRLEKEENKLLRKYLLNSNTTDFDWSYIS
ncbi:MAG: ATP-dependent DNA helicase RecG [Draconibacterium sp.]|nr:MAG: ATP-dependent DNA helicase RecG [Draconibacterium sp.]PIF05087.1 MAG: ATP-dependent DNA helicase RecG [Draconibacterium sp.]